VGKPPPDLNSFRIVTLCGSKGALSAYIKILALVPRDSGMVFVVLTHRRASRPCNLVGILSTITEMPVQEIKNFSVLLPDHVYVIPPGKDLTTDGAVFRLAPTSITYGWPNGFDLFLTSLAENTHGRSVTIILSGMAEDGSAALGKLRLNGGLAFAQSDAEVSSMPARAVRTGNVDYFCSAADIGVLISALSPLPGFEPAASSVTTAQLLVSNSK
jgi:two-component system, chemotaxis family, CheB/CheR fusion protein